MGFLTPKIVSPCIHNIHDMYQTILAKTNGLVEKQSDMEFDQGPVKIAGILIPIIK